MNWLRRLRDWVLDPPPAHVFELGPAGIAWSVEGRRGFEPLPEGVLNVQPLSDNVLNRDALALALQRLAPQAPGPRRRPCVLLLPDYSCRVTVLDFDSFPAKAEDQLALVRFRIKKSLPFDADAAALAFHAQAAPGNRREVVIAAVSLEILSRYEAALRAAGYHPGLVTPSTLAALDLVDDPPGSGLVILARLNGRVLTVTAATGGRLRLARCIELGGVSVEELSSILIPTIAYAEDEFAQPVEALHVIGIERDLWEAFGGAISPQPVESPSGPVTGQNAGLMGCLRVLAEGAKRAA